MNSDELEMLNESKYDEQDDPHYSGYCRSCGQFVDQTKTEDVGIGHYEFWGAPGCDVQLIEICPHCRDNAVEEMASQPCHVCGNYDLENYPPDGCRLAVNDIRVKGPDSLDRGDECRFWTPDER